MDVILLSSYMSFFKYLERRKEGRTSTYSDEFDKILEIKKNVSVVMFCILEYNQI